LAIAAAMSVSACATSIAHEAQRGFGGWWYWDKSEHGELNTPFLHAPFKDDIALAVDAFAGEFREASLSDPVDAGFDIRRAYCAPPRFAGFNGGFADYVEFLLTPGRLTIANESGLVRRIPLDGRNLPAEAEESNSGTSVGRWEGRTLVVETIGIDRRAGLVASPIGANAHVVERIARRAPDVLEIAVRLEAPDVLERPFETVLVYRRDLDHEFYDANPCVDEDRSLDSSSGRQRFDATPPDDLPPPPSR
jgi:hypothetical protein